MAGKLVRDNIPQIMINKGGSPKTRVLATKEYLAELDKKLQEEVAEYLENNDLAELGDILEVIRAIADARGDGIAAIEDIRAQKYIARGGFKDKIYLELEPA